MPEYLAPGVYVEETSFRSKSIEGVGTSTASFVGQTARGPSSSGTAGITPPLLTGFADFERIYGGVNDLRMVPAPVGTNPPGPPTFVTNYVAHAARAFFENGGGRLYVARVLGTGAAAASSGILNTPPTPTPAANEQVSLAGRFAGGAALPGTADVNLRVRLRQVQRTTTKELASRQQAGTLVKLGSDYFVIGTTPMQTTAADATAWTGLAASGTVDVVTLSVVVEDPSGATLEYDGLAFHPSHPRYAGRVLGDPPARAADALDNPIRLVIGDAVSAVELRGALLGAATERTVDLKDGNDGTGAPGINDFKSALGRLLALEDISIVAAPGASAMAGTMPAEVNEALEAHVQTRGAYRVAILDPPPGLEPDAVRAIKSKIDSTYTALYYPWIIVGNPLIPADPTQPPELALPPSGFVAGIYARTDINRGVWKAPANERVIGALRLQRDVRFGEQEVLNPLGVNCIRFLPPRGIRVWGARTTSSDPEWKYLNVRRYFVYVRRSIDVGTQWAVFEPNGERLWANVRNAVGDFLQNEFVSGALLGESPKQAYFVRCDRTTMTQNDLDNGRMICLVGIAVLKPAEFVIFRIGQKTADAQS